MLSSSVCIPPWLKPVLCDIGFLLFQSLAIMASLDPLKVFVGGFRPEVIKPDILIWLQELGADMDQLHDVFLPTCVGQRPRIAFVTFWDAQAAAQCAQLLNGHIDFTMTAGRIRA